MAALYMTEVPPRADSCSSKQSALNLREINRKNTHTAFASMLTYYGLIFFFFPIVLILSFVVTKAAEP
jgi:hypothetical protein